MRQKEHKKNLKQVEGVKYARARRKEFLTAIHQSVLTDHVASNKHTIDWEGVRLPAKEPDWKKRVVKESIFIRMAGMHAINQDGGCHHLPKVFTKLLCHETVSWHIHSSDEVSSVDTKYISWEDVFA